MFRVEHRPFSHPNSPDANEVVGRRGSPKNDEIRKGYVSDDPDSSWIMKRRRGPDDGSTSVTTLRYESGVSGMYLVDLFLHPHYCTPRWWTQLFQRQGRGRGRPVGTWMRPTGTTTTGEHRDDRCRVVSNCGHKGRRCIGSDTCRTSLRQRITIAGDRTGSTTWSGRRSTTKRHSRG